MPSRETVNTIFLVSSGEMNSGAVSPKTTYSPEIFYLLNIKAITLVITWKWVVS